MKTLIATLKLSASTSGRTRDRCPDVVFSHNDAVIAAIRTDTEKPNIPATDAEYNRIEFRDDAISRVIDEPTWLAEISRILAEGGELLLTLPAHGPLAWLDAMNIYRYMVDIGKRGNEPDAALPTGWNRHYPREGITTLLTDAGFENIRLRSANYAVQELGMLTALVWRNWIHGARDAEREAFPRLGARQPGKKLFPLRTTWSISAVKRKESQKPTSEPEPTPRPADPTE